MPNQIINQFLTSRVTPESPWLITAAIAIAIWAIAWKGVALWKAARIGQKKWFIALLVLNTVGILEIIYIFFVAKNKCCEVMKVEEKPPVNQ